MGYPPGAARNVSQRPGRSGRPPRTGTLGGRLFAFGYDVSAARDQPSGPRARPAGQAPQLLAGLPRRSVGATVLFEDAAACRLPGDVGERLLDLVLLALEEPDR